MIRRDKYYGIEREWRNGRVYHGLVCGKSIRPRHCRVSVTVYMVRENGEDIYSATSGTGVSRKALDLACDVAARQGLT